MHATRSTLAALSVSVLLMPAVSVAQTDDNIVVIVNPTVSATTLSQTDIRQIFTGHRQFWDDGSKIEVFVLENSRDIHKAFCRERMKMFPYQLERLWNQVTYSGQGEPPVRLSTQQELINAVQHTPGAIGYAEEGALSDANVIKVESK
ncbi:hypothetical protein [Alteromonas sp. CYL-A6]|uniref:hypothetical protein n=1 Tax=Alteromonas nitratireducens TaxID=3390813 RepID=UPI0034B2AE7E